MGFDHHLPRLSSQLSLLIRGRILQVGINKITLNPNQCFGPALSDPALPSCSAKELATDMKIGDLKKKREPGDCQQLTNGKWHGGRFLLPLVVWFGTSCHSVLWKFGELQPQDPTQDLGAL